MTTREVPARRRVDQPGHTGPPAGRSAAGSGASAATEAVTRARHAGLLARRPEALPIGATAASWIALTILTPLADWPAFSSGPTASTGHGAHGSVFTPMGMTMVALMCVAMMGPLAIPGVRYVGANSLWWRVGRATCWFFGAFIATWVVIAICLQPFAELLDGVVGSASTAAGLLSVACALAQLDRGRAGRAAGCDRPMRLRANRSDANTDCARFGLHCAARGFRLCALPMLAMLALPSSLLVMALLTVFSVADRVTQGRRRIGIAVLYAVLGAVLLI